MAGELGHNLHPLEGALAGYYQVGLGKVLNVLQNLVQKGEMKHLLASSRSSILYDVYLLHGLAKLP